MAASGRGVLSSESDSEQNPWENQESANSHRKTKNIFDDDVSFDRAKKIILNDLKDEDFENDIDEITWNDEPVPPSKTFQGSSASSEPKVNLDNLGTPSYTSPRLAASTVSVTKNTNPVKALLTHSRSLSSGGTFKPFSVSDNLSRGVSDPSIEDVVQLEANRSLGSTDINKLQAEIQALQRINLLAKRDRWSKLPVENTIKRMLKGEACTLEFYKSLDDKLKLIDESVKVHDGNCIIATVLFLKRTVKASIFNFEVSRRPVALNHYLNYLRTKLDYQELSMMLEMTGRTEEAAMLQYKVASNSTLGASKTSALRNVLRSHFSMDQQLASEAALVAEHIDLLERQSPIEESDAREEASGRNQMFRNIPRRRSIFEMPLITTLYYCCLYHFHLSENSLASPVAIRKRHHICDKQFLYCALGAQARLQKWRTIEELLTTKSWFGGTKMKSAIGWDKVVNILNKHNAPLDLLHKYLNFIDDLELKAEVAKKNSIVLSQP
ncbi:hypothetical protein SNE40_012237 [Patella caerulea]|uniref:VPS33B-interacting protein in apical-basolateral polarity regulator n=1 Tax=Patella caerulea TaxID=87958 RepID=A0AAN8PMY5_PATCE